jgi:hypothetical protein
MCLKAMRKGMEAFGGRLVGLMFWGNIFSKYIYVNGKHKILGVLFMQGLNM